MAKGTEPRPGPRPRGPFEDKRRTLTTRITDGTRDRLDTAAAAAGRSLSQEIEMRLEQSFRDEDRAVLFSEAFYGPQLAGILQLIGAVTRNVVAQSQWLEDPGAFSTVLTAIEETLSAIRPAGDDLKRQDVNLTREISRHWLLQIAAKHAPDDRNYLARWGRSVRAGLGEPAAARIAKWLGNGDVVVARGGEQ